MSTYKRPVLLLLVLSLLLSACSLPGLSATPISAAAQPTSSPGAELVEPGPDATVTPTPFQPLPPTAVYLPTDLPTLTPTPTATPTPTPPVPVAPAGPAGSLPSTPGQINILLLGSDKRPWDVGFRTDTIILATLNPSKGTVSLTSIPRDLYINIPGWGVDRINTAWGHGGFKKLAATLEFNFGVTPDHYVLINFSSFKRIIDSLGGLDVNVQTQVSDYRNGRYVTVNPGVHHMDADDVLWYVRSRKTTNDFARARRQHEALMALFDKMLTLNAVKRVPEFYNIYKENVTTDLGLTDILSMLPLAAKLTDPSQIHHYYIGPKQVYDYITPGGAMVLLPRQDKIMDVFRQALGGE
jgi:LCP family protein required for cell wall assembly